MKHAGLRVVTPAAHRHNYHLSNTAKLYLLPLSLTNLQRDANLFEEVKRDHNAKERWRQEQFYDLLRSTSLFSRYYHIHLSCYRCCRRYFSALLRSTVVTAEPADQRGWPPNSASTPASSTIHDTTTYRLIFLLLSQHHLYYYCTRTARAWIAKCAQAPSATALRHHRNRRQRHRLAARPHAESCGVTKRSRSKTWGVGAT